MPRPASPVRRHAARAATLLGLALSALAACADGPTALAPKGATQPLASQEASRVPPPPPSTGRPPAPPVGSHPGAGQASGVASGVRASLSQDGSGLPTRSASATCLTMNDGQTSFALVYADVHQMASWPGTNGSQWVFFRAHYWEQDWFGAWRHLRASEWLAAYGGFGGYGRPVYRHQPDGTWAPLDLFANRRVTLENSNIFTQWVGAEYYWGRDESGRTGFAGYGHAEWLGNAGC